MKWSEFSFILKPSSTVEGIGVFTTHNISSEMQVFSGEFSPRKMRVKDIPGDFVKYCIFLDDDFCLCPQRFDRMEIGWYLNHSDQPNIAKKINNRLFAIRDIQAGEEILIDYNQFDEPENLKDSFYKKLFI